MKSLELFCGTKSFSKVAKKYGIQTTTLDYNADFSPDIICDIMNYEPTEYYDIVWASPPCQCFSVATIGRNWNKDYTPKTNKARNAIKLIEKTLEIIRHIQPMYYFIENPMGMLRKHPLMKDFKRYTITYCQYGDTRMKPTDIWTNCDKWMPRPMCKPGSPCHQSAPRGSKMGTQGLKNAIERGIIPQKLCEEIVKRLFKE